MSQPEKTSQGFVSTARTALEIFSQEEELCELTSRDTLDFDALRQKKAILYLIAPEHRMVRYGFLVNLLLNQLFEFCIENQGNGIFFLLEELANVGKIENLERVLTVLRKRKVGTALILQSLD